MTNKEFFIKVLKEEAPKFRVAIDALPEDKHEHKVHDRSREAGNLAAQLGVQWKAISGIVNAGVPEFNPHEMKKQSKADMLAKFDQGMPKLISDLEAISDQAWENDLSGWDEKNKNDKKFNMAWMFLFDAIHHRGQLATYLRAMGAKVPAIYGPSADSQS